MEGRIRPGRGGSDLRWDRCRQNRTREIALGSSKFESVQEFSRTTLSWALLTMLWRVMIKQAVEVASTSRCKRYQVVCGILRSSSDALRRRSTTTKGKLPSRNSRSAALIASKALVQRTQRRWCREALPGPKADGSKESRPSINARK